jgi:predicted RNA binding protein YcfA (HicA-like mRNA interferase family)
MRHERRLRTPFLPVGESVKVRDVIKRLAADGWYRIRSKSGHRQFKHAAKTGRVTVSGQLGVDVPVKTLKSIWKQAQLPEEQ